MKIRIILAIVLATLLNTSIVSLASNTYAAVSDQYRNLIANNSTISLSSVNASINEVVDITVTINGPGNSPLPGHTIKVRTSGGNGVVLDQVSPTTDKNGQVIARVFSSSPGDISIYATDLTYIKSDDVIILISDRPTLSISSTPTVNISGNLFQGFSLSSIPSVLNLIPAQYKDNPIVKTMINFFEYNVCETSIFSTISVYFLFLLFPLIWKMAENRRALINNSAIYAGILLVTVYLLKAQCLSLVVGIIIWAILTSLLITPFREFIGEVLRQDY